MMVNTSLKSGVLGVKPEARSNRGGNSSSLVAVHGRSDSI